MKHILIVDDALEIGRLLQSALATLDMKIKTMVVPSAEEALLEAAHYPIDLLVTDIRLPGLSGTDLVRKMRSLHPALKVIMITGMSRCRIRAAEPRSESGQLFPQTDQDQ